MYVYYNTAVQLRKDCSREKAINLTNFCACAFVYMCVCVCVGVDAQSLAFGYAHVALIIQNVTRRHVPVCGLFGSTVFFDITS
jgi:hypothetical protein